MITFPQQRISAKVMNANNDTMLEGTLVGPSTSEDTMVANHDHGQVTHDQMSIENLPGSLNSIDEFNDDRSFAKRAARKIETDDGKIPSASISVAAAASMVNASAWLSSVSTSQASTAIPPLSSHSLNGPHPSSTPVVTAYSLVARPAPVQSQLVPRPPYNLSVPQSLPSYQVGPSRAVKVDLPCMFGRKPLSSSESQGLERISAALDRFPLLADSRTMLRLF